LRPLRLKFLETKVAAINCRVLTDFYDNKRYLLEKYQRKGGWTYAAIPEVLQDKNSPFGWGKVNGRIDDLEITN
jgi:hypothetical protein